MNENVANVLIVIDIVITIRKYYLIKRNCYMLFLEKLFIPFEYDFICVSGVLFS